MENETGPAHDYFLWRQGRIFAETARKHLVTAVFDVIGFTLSIGLVLMGYTYGKDASQRILTSASSGAPKIKISIYPTRPVVPTWTSTDTTLDCPMGLEPIASNLLELCLPPTFIKDSNSNTSEHFRMGEEEFVINAGALEQFSIHLCHLEKEVLVAGNIATRTIFREEIATGCGEMIGFATTVYDGPNGDVQLHLWKNAGIYTSEDAYEKIEQSMRFK